MSHTAVIAYGGNVGDVQNTFLRTRSLLQAAPLIRIEKSSRVYRTTPVGSQAGDPFLNGAWLIETDLSPLELLDRLQFIEHEMGRQRTIHWGPRPLDLDIVSYDNQVFDLPRLRVPHPAAWYRRFVLDPWSDVAPDWQHPVLLDSVTEIRHRLLSRPMRIGVLSDDAVLKSVLAEFANAGRIAITDAAHEIGSCAIIFTTRSSTPPFPCGVILPKDGTASETARQILIAALDEPIPLPD